MVGIQFPHAILCNFKLIKEKAHEERLEGS